MTRRKWTARRHTMSSLPLLNRCGPSPRWWSSMQARAPALAPPVRWMSVSSCRLPPARLLPRQQRCRNRRKRKSRELPTVAPTVLDHRCLVRARQRRARLAQRRWLRPHHRISNRCLSHNQRLRCHRRCRRGPSCGRCHSRCRSNSWKWLSCCRQGPWFLVLTPWWGPSSSN